MLSARLASRAPLALAHTTRIEQAGNVENECGGPVRGSLAKIHSPVHGCERVRERERTGSEEVDLAHVTSIRLGIRRFRDTRSVHSYRPQIGLFFEHGLLNFIEVAKGRGGGPERVSKFQIPL
jgi:hypothetical protein